MSHRNEPLTLNADIKFVDNIITAKIVPPDKSDMHAPVSLIVFHDYPVTFKCWWYGIDVNALALASQFSDFKKRTNMALGAALQIFIDNGFEVAP